MPCPSLSKEGRKWDVVYGWDPNMDGVIHPVTINSAFSVLCSYSSSAGGGGHGSKAELLSYQIRSARGPCKAEIEKRVERIFS